MKIFKWICWAILFIVLGTSITYGQSVVIYQYALLVKGYEIPPTADLVLLKVNASGQSTWEVRPITIPTGYTASDEIALSPNGEWGAIIFYRYQGIYGEPVAILRVSNLLTNFTTEYAQIFGFPTLQSIYYHNESLSWSPDSTSVAANITDTSNFSTILVYDSTSNSWSIDNTSIAKSRVAWSPDSNLIITGSYFDCVSTGCREQVRIYNANSTVTPIDMPMEQYIGISPCNFIWSPNGLYNVFGSGCRPSASSEAIDELYLVNTQFPSIERLTDYTFSAATQLGNPPSEGIYDTYWIDNNNFVTGVLYAPQLPNLLTETFHYNVAQHQKTVLDTKFRYDWADNPSNDLVAFQRADGMNTNYTPINPTVEIAQWNGQQFISLFEGRNGCNLTWSPDGQFLGYTPREFLECRPYSNVTSVVIVNATTLTSQEYPITFNTTNKSVIPLGWVKRG